MEQTFRFIVRALNLHICSTNTFPIIVSRKIHGRSFAVKSSHLFTDYAIIICNMHTMQILSIYTYICIFLSSISFRKRQDCPKRQASERDETKAERQCAKRDTPLWHICVPLGRVPFGSFMCRWGVSLSEHLRAVGACPLWHADAARARPESREARVRRP